MAIGSSLTEGRRWNDDGTPVVCMYTNSAQGATIDAYGTRRRITLSAKTDALLGCTIFFDVVVMLSGIRVFVDLMARNRLLLIGIQSPPGLIVGVKLRYIEERLATRNILSR